MYIFKRFTIRERVIIDTWSLGRRIGLGLEVYSQKNIYIAIELFVPFFKARITIIVGE